MSSARSRLNLTIELMDKLYQCDDQELAKALVKSLSEDIRNLCDEIIVVTEENADESTLSYKKDIEIQSLVKLLACFIHEYAHVDTSMSPAHLLKAVQQTLVDEFQSYVREIDVELN